MPETRAPLPSNHQAWKLPGIALGVVLVVLFVWLLWPDAPGTPGKQATENEKTLGVNEGSGGLVARGPGGGVQARDFDEARNPEVVANRRRDMQNQGARGMRLAPPSGPKERTFDTKAEEIAYYEKQLEQTQRRREQQWERLKELEKQAAVAEDLGAHEKKMDRARSNYEASDVKIEELQRKLKSLGS